MSQILIVSKTIANGGFCVGGIELSSNRSVRLKTSTGGFQPFNGCPFEIGDVHEVNFSFPATITPPHTETIHVNTTIKLGSWTLSQIANHVYTNQTVWRGGPESLFCGMLRYYAGSNSNSGYISVTAYPMFSLGYWVSTVDLNLRTSFNKTYYDLIGVNAGIRSFKYVGTQQSIQVIPAGTLIRVSLAQWWDGWWSVNSNEPKEFRCYLQLSGWYL